jgi:hypothetical protein
MKIPKTICFLALNAVALVVLSTAWVPAAAQVPLGITSARGLEVTPVFEGWYENPDGTFTLSFGYFNRNWEEVVNIPIGKDNFIEPAEFNGGQPTQFNSRRHWGVFGVKVPADFGSGKVVWTLRIRGETNSIPGALKTDWQIDALVGEATFGNKPPVLAFSQSGPEGAGPAGLMGPVLSGRVGTAVKVSVWAKDDGRRSGSVRRPGSSDAPVTLTWFKHSGPGEVTFAEESGEVPVAGGMMATEATFGEPGKYTLRVRANDVSGVTGAGHSQCCWTNGFVKVTISP